MDEETLKQIAQITLMANIKIQKAPMLIGKIMFAQMKSKTTTEDLLA